MAEETQQQTNVPPARSKDEIALELMKFIAMTTGFGKGSTAAGYGSKGARSSDEYAESLLDLFERCRKTVNS